MSPRPVSLFARVLSFLCMLALVVLAAGCGDKSEDGNKGASGISDGANGEYANLPDKLTIGIAGPMTGRGAAFGKQIQFGAKIAVKEINAKGGIAGRKFDLVIEDDESNPGTAGQVATRLVNNPDIVAVIGHFNSDCSLAGKDIYNSAKMLQISPASTNVNVTLNAPYTYRVIFNDKFQGQTLADYIAKRLNKKKVAVLYENDSYGKGLYEHFKEQSKVDGLELVAELSYETDTTDFRPLLTSIKEKNAEMLVICGLYQSGGQIASQSRELGLALPMMGGDGLFEEELIKIGGKASEGMLVTCPFLFELAGERGEKFREEVRKDFGEDANAWAALTYDAVQLVYMSAIGTGFADGDSMKRFMDSLNNSNKAVPLLTGKTYFDAEGDCMKAVQVAVIRDGKFVAADIQMDDALTASVKQAADAAAAKSAAAPKP